MLGASCAADLQHRYLLANPRTPVVLTVVSPATESTKLSVGLEQQC